MKNAMVNAFTACNHGTAVSSFNMACGAQILIILCVILLCLIIMNLQSITV